MDMVKAHREEGLESPKTPLRSRSRNLLIPFAVIVAVLSLVAYSILTLDGPNSRRAAQEASAVGKLRRLTTLQNNYSASHPKEGFACRLSVLKPTAPSEDDYYPDEFWSSETHRGYRIALTGCEPEPNGLVTHYRATAVPLEPGKSGIRAFCTDQTGALWHDDSGSAENCLKFRRALN
jgi:hypothetical protein